MARLVDHSFNEYLRVKELLDEEIKTNDKLTYRFEIINHLENCINSINRVASIVDLVINGRRAKGKIIPGSHRGDIQLFTYIDSELVEKIRKHSVIILRNRVEHISEDIYQNIFIGGLFLDIDVKYKNICISKKCIEISKLAGMIEDYHHLVLSILNNLR